MIKCNLCSANLRKSRIYSCCGWSSCSSCAIHRTTNNLKCGFCGNKKFVTYPNPWYDAYIEYENNCSQSTNSANSWTEWK